MQVLIPPKVQNPMLALVELHEVHLPQFCCLSGSHWIAAQLDRLSVTPPSFGSSANWMSESTLCAFIMSLMSVLNKTGPLGNTMSSKPPARLYTDHSPLRPCSGSWYWGSTATFIFLTSTKGLFIVYFVSQNTHLVLSPSPQFPTQKKKSKTFVYTILKSSRLIPSFMLSVKKQVHSADGVMWGMPLKSSFSMEDLWSRLSHSHSWISRFSLIITLTNRKNTGTHFLIIGKKKGSWKM